MTAQTYLSGRARVTLLGTRVTRNSRARGKCETSHQRVAEYPSFVNRPRPGNSTAKLAVVAVVALLIGIGVTLAVKRGGRAGSVATGASTTSSAGAATNPATTRSTGNSPTTTRSKASTTRPKGDFATIKVSELPPEGRTTLKLIASNGPFPFPKNDGVVFSNFEKVLPSQPKGYYHEYTVITPGAPTRGTRRIITGKSGEQYYTNDHYKSFKIVVEG
jgi:ribonuclease T1